MKSIVKLGFGFIGLCLAHSSFTQNQPVQGKLYHEGNGKLSILQIHPDSIPQISVLFRAEKKDGTPYFGLSKSSIILEENDRSCPVLTLKPLSEALPITVNMVLDHSGSMLMDYSELIRLKIRPNDIKIDKNGQPIFPNKYTSPLQHAKNSLNRFIEGLNTTKDKIGLVGFSTTVDAIQEPTNNKKQLQTTIENIKADSLTAFYDALMVALQNFPANHSMSVVVALTDGMDNSSVFNLDDVVTLANEKDIPIYIVGLGDVLMDSLDLLANSTDGQFFYAKSANLLDSTYQLIQNRIKAFYELTYETPSMLASDSLRQIFIGFQAEDSSLLYDKQLLKLNPALRQRIIEIAKEQEQMRLQNSLLSLAGFLTVGTLGAGLFFVAFRPRKIKSNSVLKLYPNPADTQTTIQIRQGELPGELWVSSMQGNRIFEQTMATPTIQLNTGSWPGGTYTVNFSNSRGTALQTSLVIQH